MEPDTYTNREEQEIREHEIRRMQWEIEQLKEEMRRLQREENERQHIQRAVRHTPEEWARMTAPPRTRYEAEMGRREPIWEDARAQLDAYRTIMDRMEGKPREEENEGWDK